MKKPSSTYTGNTNPNPSNAFTVKLKAKYSVISYVKDFDYTGSEQTWTAPYAGYYKLEVWGGQGGKSYGYGGYSVGITQMSINKSIYVNVAGAGIFCSTKGAVCLGGYNGGGNGHAAAYAWSGAPSANPTSGGGGATHIATISGQLRNLSAYKDSGGANVSNEILIVAGGGGGYGECNYVGGCTNNLLYAYGGVGGGIYGGSGRCIVAATGQPFSWDGSYGGTGANQTSPGTGQNGGSAPRTGGFGYGGTGADTCDNGNCGDNGGGAGWFGGGGTVRGHNGGGGGSGYIGSSNLISGGGVTKHMTCYSCTTSSAAATRTYSNTTTPTSTPTADVARIGNGYARITYLGTSL